MSEVINYLRSGNAEQAKLNQILQTLQKLITPVDGDPNKQLIVYAPENKVRLTSVTTGSANISNTDEKDRVALVIRKKPSLIQNSYGLSDSVTGSISFPNTNLKYSANAQFENDYITIPSNTSLDVTTFTVSAWFYITGNQTSAKIIEKASSFSIEMANQQIKASVSGEYTSLYTVTPNAWHNVTITFSSQSLKLYVDNVLKETKTISGTFSSNTNLVKIGEGFVGSLSWLNYCSGVKSASWVSDWYSNGILELSNEIFTFDFIGTANATPSQMTGFVISS
jgi:hypothetical protein